MRWCRSQKPATSPASFFPIVAGYHPAVRTTTGSRRESSDGTEARLAGSLAAEERTMSVGTIILIILIIALLGGFSGIGGGPFYGTGYYGGGGVGLVLVIPLIFVLVGSV